MPVLVYQDYRHNHGALFASLCAHFGADGVRYCDAADIENGVLGRDDIRLFVMPGGADLFYCEKLNGAANAAIRDFVLNKGGTYLGICAGAYYGCAAIEWAADDPGNRIAGPRELAFYSGTAIGPVYAFIEDGDVTKNWDHAALLSFSESVSKEKAVFLYSGGSLFTEPQRPEEQVIARYDTLPGRPPAIVECRAGKGKAILSGVHPEYSAALYRRTMYAHLSASPARQENVATQLEADGITSGEIWKNLLDRAAGDNA